VVYDVAGPEVEGGTSSSMTTTPTTTSPPSRPPRLAARRPKQNRPANTTPPGRSNDSLYDPVLGDSEREAVSDLLEYLEHVRATTLPPGNATTADDAPQRGDADFDFYSGEPLRALSTLIFSGNVDLQRSAALTFAEITDRGELWRERRGGPGGR
jgi:hypothetical protein